jgi:small ligand-binding sensory domain FIST
VTADHLGYDGFQVGVAVIRSDSIRFSQFVAGGLPDNEYQVGLDLGGQVSAATDRETANLLIMYDAVKGPPLEGMVFNLNLATPLVQGMTQALGQWPPVAGVGMLGDWQGKPTYQWFDDQIVQQSAMALAIAGDVRMDTTIMHGCRPSSGYHTITGAENNVVLEIDGKPALEMIAELLGSGSYKSWEDFPFFVTLGLNKGDKYGEFREEDYANRLVMGIDRKRRGLIMFENDLKSGSDVQLMRRSIDLEYVEGRAKAILRRVSDRKPFFAFYIDCAGRGSAYCGTDGEEASGVQRTIGSSMPLLGIYSGVEIAKVGPDIQALDWTGVLCVFSE